MNGHIEESSLWGFRLPQGYPESSEQWEWSEPRIADPRPHTAQQQVSDASNPHNGSTGAPPTNQGVLRRGLDMLQEAQSETRRSGSRGSPQTPTTRQGDESMAERVSSVQAIHHDTQGALNLAMELNAQTLRMLHQQGFVPDTIMQASRCWTQADIAWSRIPSRGKCLVKEPKTAWGSFSD